MPLIIQIALAHVRAVCIMRATRSHSVTQAHWAESIAMTTLELFVHREGAVPPDILILPATATVADVFEAARTAGFIAEDRDFLLSCEDAEITLDRHLALAEAGIGQHHHVHLSRATRIEVTVAFNGTTHDKHFPPSATIARVKRWAGNEFGLDPSAMASHVLQVHGTHQQPGDDAHLGSLVTPPQHQLRFDLVPKKRVEG